MPRCLDLFCGAGGCSVGYARSGWSVTGADRVFHEAYPDPSHGLFAPTLDVSCTFVQADAMELVRDRDYLDQFQFVAASPPCPGYSTITPDAAAATYPRLIAPLVEALEAWGGPYVIENVEGAASAMPGAVRLCGSSFGLRVRRHRLFLSNLPLTAPPCNHAAQGEPIGVYGGHPESGGGRFPRPRTGTSRGIRAATLSEAGQAMGIDWMGWDDLTDAIPPAYTEHLGRQVLAAAVGVVDNSWSRPPPGRHGVAARVRGEPPEIATLRAQVAALQTQPTTDAPMVRDAADAARRNA